MLMLFEELAWKFICAKSLALMKPHTQVLKKFPRVRQGVWVPIDTRPLNMQFKTEVSSKAAASSGWHGVHAASFIWLSASLVLNTAKSSVRNNKND